jgi:UDP-2,3-diacylglucosamine pyrophosphatase LpxH
MRAASRKSVARKPREEMEIVGTAVRERFLEGYEALICGHVHLAGTRDYGTPESPRPVHVLGDWTPGGVSARIDPRGVELLDFP